MLKERIKISRKFKGFSQELLSKKLGITKWTLINYEKGQNEPTASMIIKISEICNINSNWLLTGKGEMLLENGKNNISQVNVNGNNIGINSGLMNINNEKRTIKTIDDIIEDDLEILKYFKRLSSKKQEYYFHLIKADVLKDEIDNDFKE